MGGHDNVLSDLLLPWYVFTFLQHTINDLEKQLAEISRCKKDADDRVIELEGEVNRLAERCKELVITSELSVEVIFFRDVLGYSLCSVISKATLAPL